MRPMPARFCPQCGTKSFPDAKFCHHCGTSLGSGAPATSAPGFRATPLGGTVLGVFVIVGLGIWYAILTPAPPRPGLGAGARAATAQATAPAAPPELPAGHPKVSVPLPTEAKSFIADLAAKAKEQPRDVDTWVKLGQVDFRAAQIDAAYYADALTAFQHVLDIDPKNPDALRGVANIHYDRDEHEQAIPFYERFLALRPDDESARTDLATMYLYSGQAERAIATYKDVIRRNPSFLQAHYNLGVTYHGQGDDPAALAELETARGLAPDDTVRGQIDEMIGTLKGGAPAPATPRPTEAADRGGAKSPFQSAAEEVFRGHPMMGPRIVRFEWASSTAGRVLVANFPMQSMPDDVRTKFTDRLSEQLRSARSAHPVDGTVRVDIADASSGAVMATVTP